MFPLPLELPPLPEPPLLPLLPLPPELPLPPDPPEAPEDGGGGGVPAPADDGGGLPLAVGAGVFELDEPLPQPQRSSENRSTRAPPLARDMNHLAERSFGFSPIRCKQLRRVCLEQLKNWHQR